MWLYVYNVNHSEDWENEEQTTVRRIVLNRLKDANHLKKKNLVLLKVENLIFKRNVSKTWKKVTVCENINLLKHINFAKFSQLSEMDFQLSKSMV